MDLSERLASVYFTPESQSSHAQQQQLPQQPQQSQQPQQPQIDRIAEFRENMPTSGITLFSHRSAPNGFKVAVALSELGIEYRTIYIDLNKHEERSPGYVELNPNARVPTIVDHDNGHFALWESGAILQYLCHRPQTIAKSPELARRLLGGDSIQQQAQVSAWLYFQASGHAPIIGHALQFRFVEANMPSNGISVVAERFVAEARRVCGVLEVTLAERREQLSEDMSDVDEFLQRPVWLVGDDMTLADLSFVPWNQVLDKLGIDLKGDFPEVYKWTQTLLRRPRVQAALGARR